MKNNHMEISSCKFYVGLGSTVAIFKWNSFSTNQRVEELSKPNGLAYFGVDSLKEAAELTQIFINEFNLGSSNWTGGIVLDNTLNFVAKVSYNGRIWDSEDWQSAKEIIEC